MESYAIGSVGIAGGGVGFNPSVNVFDHPPSCASLPVLGSEITPTDLFWCFIGACDCISVYQLQLVCTVIIQLQYHISIIKLSRSVIVHTCITLLLKWQQNCGAIIIYVYCVQHWLCASYSPASNPLWGGVLFPCKRVAAFPFVGLRITHLNTLAVWPDQGRVNQKYSTHVRRALAVKTELLQWLYLGDLWLKLWRANYT